MGRESRLNQTVRTPGPHPDVANGLRQSGARRRKKEAMRGHYIVHGATAAREAWEAAVIAGKNPIFKGK